MQVERAGGAARSRTSSCARSAARTPRAAPGARGRQDWHEWPGLASYAGVTTFLATPFDAGDGAVERTREYLATRASS